MWKNFSFPSFLEITQKYISAKLNPGKISEQRNQYNTYLKLNDILCI